jgi:hypothetical protein
MGTEKLAEGIRGFVNDCVALENLLKDRLDGANGAKSDEE